jgi:hypothetical protein
MKDRIMRYTTDTGQKGGTLLHAAGRDHAARRRGGHQVKRRPATINTGPDLFAWADAQAARQRKVVPPRVILVPEAANPDGLPRAGLLHPGARLPVLYSTLPAALAALASMEVRA